MKFKRILSVLMMGILTLSATSAFAMPTTEFDRGMNKGIEYYNRELYYEARDEFQWFCDYNWGKMNSGQQKYALDYLGAAKQKIQQLENRNNGRNNNTNLSSNNYNNYPMYYKHPNVPDYGKVTDSYFVNQKETDLNTTMYGYITTSDKLNYYKSVIKDMGYRFVDYNKSVSVYLNDSISPKGLIMISSLSSSGTVVIGACTGSYVDTLLSYGVIK